MTSWWRQRYFVRRPHFFSVHRRALVTERLSVRVLVNPDLSMLTLSNS